MTDFAKQRVEQGIPLYGLLLAHDRMARGTIIDQIEAWSRRERDEAFAYPIQYLRPY